LGFSQRFGWIGVDVGTHSVKLAQAVRDGAGARLHRAAVIQRPESWSSAESLALEQPISSCAEIRAALECGGFEGRDAICSLPMNVCQLRCLNVPPGTDQERRTIIGGELAEDWADLPHAMEFDFWEMEPAKSEKPVDSFNVSVLAASRLWVSQLFRDCRKSGIDCWSIDGVPLAMARAMSFVGAANSGRRVLAVDWGYSSVTFCIVGDGRPLYSRRIHDCAFSRVLDAIMGAFIVTHDEAQHLVDSQGVAADEADSSADRDMQHAIAESIAAPMEELIRQLRRTLQFTEAQRRHLQPASVWLLGGGASMRNVDSFLTGQLGIPVHPWSLPHEGDEIACAAGQRAAVFGNALALSAAAWGAAA
jgi:type IV pilus assembly protein PilM